MKRKDKKVRAKNKTRMIDPGGGYKANEQVHKAKNKYSRKAKNKKYYDEEYKDEDNFSKTDKGLEDS